MRLPTCIGVSAVSSCRNSASSALRCLIARHSAPETENSPGFSRSVRIEGPRDPSRSAKMERKQASDFPPEVLELFDGYVHGHLSRRDFLDRAAGYTAGGMGA